MDKIKSANIAGKMSKAFSNLKQNKMTMFFVVLIVVLILLVVLLVVYLSLLESSDLDVTWHESKVQLDSKEKKNIAASNIPSVSASEYSFHTWFAVDKSQYNKKQTTNYSHLISYGYIKNKNDSPSTRFAIGVWLENSTNDLCVIYRTDDEDSSQTDYDPNSTGFNCPNKVELRNILLNEWNLISLVVQSNTLLVYLNGQLYNTKIHTGLIYYDQAYPSLDICVGMDNNIRGLLKSVRFRDRAWGSDEVADLYFSGPNKFVLPDFRNKEYIDGISDSDIFSHLGSDSGTIKFLDKGADMIDGALGTMNNFFKSF